MFRTLPPTAVADSSCEGERPPVISNDRSHPRIEPPQEIHQTGRGFAASG